MRAREQRPGKPLESAQESSGFSPGEHVNVSEYFRSMRLVSETMLQSCANHMDDNLAAKRLSDLGIQGRDGSARCEEIIKKAIRETKRLVVEDCNSALDKESLGFKVLEIVASSNGNESDNRTMSDMQIIVQRPDGSVTEEQFNIKVTKGNSSDNVCGWSGLFLAATGECAPGLKRSAFEERLMESDFDAPPSDYHLLAFRKTSVTVREMFQGAKYHSLLTAPEESLIVNINQACPIQFNSDKAQAGETDFLSEFCRDEGDIDIRLLRKNFITRIYDEIMEKELRKLNRTKNVRDFLKSSENAESFLG